MTLFWLFRSTTPKNLVLKSHNNFWCADDSIGKHAQNCQPIVANLLIRRNWWIGAWRRRKCLESLPAIRQSLSSMGSRKRPLNVEVERRSRSLRKPHLKWGERADALADALSPTETCALASPRKAWDPIRRRASNFSSPVANNFLRGLSLHLIVDCASSSSSPRMDVPRTYSYAVRHLSSDHEVFSVHLKRLKISPLYDI